MEHSVESYLKRFSTSELETMLQYYLQNSSKHGFEIQEILKELAQRQT